MSEHKTLPLLIAGGTGILALSLASISCVNTPTVPLPPPDQASFYITAPDADGVVHVTGDIGAFPTWASEEDRVYGLVINLNTNRGVIEPANMDGSFEAWIEALSGDQLVVQTWGAGGDTSIPVYLPLVP